MKSYFSALFSAFIIMQLQAQVIEFNNPEFERLLRISTLVDNDLDGRAETRADLNGDGAIDVSEAAKILGIILPSTSNINDISDIVHFNNLKLFDNSRSSIAVSSAYFSKHTKLKYIAIHTNDNQINFSNYTNLDSCKILITENARNIFIKNNPSLAKAEIVNGKGSNSSIIVDTIDVSNNKLKTFAVKFRWNNENTKYFDASNNELEEIELNAITIFTDSWLSSDLDQFDYFDVSKNKLAGSVELRSIAFVDISNNQFTELIVSNVEQLFIENNTFESVKFFILKDDIDINYKNLDLTAFKDLKNITISSSIENFESIDISGLHKLEKVDIGVKNISGNIYMYDCPNLTNLNVAAPCNLYLNHINEKGILKVENLYFSNESITTADFSETDPWNFSEVDTLFIENNANLSIVKSNFVMSSLHLNNNPKLEVISHSFGRTSDLSVNQCFNLKKIQTDYPFEYFNFDSLPQLTEIISTEEHVDWRHYNYNFTNNLPALKTILLPMSMQSSLTLKSLPALEDIQLYADCFINLSLNDLPSLQQILISGSGWDCNDETVGPLSINNFPELKRIIIRGNGPKFSRVDFYNLPNLDSMKLNFKTRAAKGQINMYNLPKIEELELERFSAEKIHIHHLENLKILKDDNVHAKHFHLADLPSLEKVRIDTRSPNVYFENLPKLVDLALWGSERESILLNNLPALKNFFQYRVMSSDRRDTLKMAINNIPNLESFDLYYDMNVDTLDLSSCKKLNNIFLETERDA